MRRAILPMLLVFCVANAYGADPRRPSDRPAWATGVEGWGVLEVPKAVGDSDLERLEWKRGMLVAQDRHDTIYVLDPSSGEVQEYTKRGNRHGGWHVGGWEPLEVIPALAGFATDQYGDVFAVASREKVCVFDHRKVLATAKLPTFVTGLAFAGADIFAARLPVEFVHPKTKTSDPPEMRRSFLVSRLDAEGQTLGESVKPDDVEGGDPFSLALTQAVRIAADQRSENGAVWLADRFRTYRLRRLSRTGSLEAEWHDAGLKGTVVFSGPVPKEVTQNFTKEGAVGYQPIDAKIVVRDVAVRNGLVFALLEPGTVGEMPMIDIVLDATSGPLWRFALHSAISTTYDRLLVTDSDFWLFPVAPGAHPTLVERVPDEVIRQSATASSAAAPR